MCDGEEEEEEGYLCVIVRRRRDALWYDHMTVTCTYSIPFASLLPSLSFSPPPFP